MHIRLCISPPPRPPHRRSPPPADYSTESYRAGYKSDNNGPPCCAAAPSTSCYKITPIPATPPPIAVPRAVARQHRQDGAGEPRGEPLPVANERQREVDGLHDAAHHAVPNDALRRRRQLAVQHVAVAPAPDSTFPRLPEGAGQVFGVREAEERHGLEVVQRAPRQPAGKWKRGNYVQNWELASMNWPSVLRMAMGTGDCRKRTW